MTDAHQTLPGAWEDGDVEHVVRTLRRAGPLRIRDLDREPELLDWSAQRVEQAVVSAWSRNLIFIDPGDLLVAI